MIHMSAGLGRIAREFGAGTVITVNDYWPLCARVQLIRPDGVRCEENQGLGCFLCVKEKDYTRIPVARQMLPVLEPFVALFPASRSLPGMANLAQYASEFRDMSERHEFVVGGYAACDLVIGPSRFLRQKLIDTGKFDAHRVLYSDYGTLTDNVRAIHKRPDDKGRVRFGYVGSLVWYKGVDVLVRAMGRLVGVSAVLHVWGDFKPDQDPHHAELQRLARDSGAQVEFHGRFDNNDIASVYEQLDVLVVPSVWFENSPITIHESYLFETPLVVSDIGGMAELVRDGVDGLHFKVGDDADLARVLSRFVDEKDLLARLSKNWPRIKTMAEDAAEMEVRYRQLACIVREKKARVVLDKIGIATASREGPVEQQGAEMLLLRSGGAAVEYDASALGAGRFVVRVDVFALGAEARLPLGGRVMFDGVQVGSIARFSSGGRDGIRSFHFDCELAAPPRRLRIETRCQAGGTEHFLRIARVVVREADSRSLDSARTRAGAPA
jgi:glycosyltransferase involved in cell wall biosynthesis